MNTNISKYDILALSSVTEKPIDYVESVVEGKTIPDPEFYKKLIQGHSSYVFTGDHAKNVTASNVNTISMGADCKEKEMEIEIKYLKEVIKNKNKEIEELKSKYK